MTSETAPGQPLTLLKQCGVPLALGMVTEWLCDLLKQSVHYFTTNVSSDISLGVFVDLRDPDLWIGLLVVIVLVATAAWLAERWRFGHPKEMVRAVVFVAGVIAAAFLIPWDHVFREETLTAFHEARLGEPMAVVLGRFQHESPIWWYREKIMGTCSIAPGRVGFG